MKELKDLNDNKINEYKVKVEEIHKSSKKEGWILFFYLEVLFSFSKKAVVVFKIISCESKLNSLNKSIIFSKFSWLYSSWKKFCFIFVLHNKKSRDILK